MAAAAEVLTRRMQNMQVLLLNRPAALNALNHNMVKIMTPKLKLFDESDVTKTVLLTSVEGSRAFCAGGDIKALTQAESGAREDIAAAVGFMQNEYELNHLIGTANKPIIALINGIAMGGGIGLSVHAPFRIATEKSVFAMPETGIGLFPDVGGSFFLPRLDGELGTYLGLTGQRLKGMEVFMAGIATHFVPSDRLPALLDRLGALDVSDVEVVNNAIEEYVAEPPSVADWKAWSLGGAVGDAINRCFAGKTLEEILEALDKEGTAWAKSTKDTIKSMSPTSLKVTLEQLRRGREQDFATCFRMEYRMVQESLQSHDFFEGVKARLYEKREPVWNPSWEDLSAPGLTLEDITKRFFTKRSSLPESLSLISPRLNLHNNLSYFESSPDFEWVPTDRDVSRVLKSFGGNLSRALDQLSIILVSLPELVQSKVATGEEKSDLLKKWRAFSLATPGSDALRYALDSVTRRLPVTLVIGNEAADCDSVVSAISLSVLLTHKYKSCFVPMVSIPRAEFPLRTDAAAALSTARIDSNDLLFTDSLAISRFRNDNAACRAVLVDHNVPALSLTQCLPQLSVVGIVDHHVDEAQFTDCELMRTISPCGSATSLVALMFRDTDRPPVDSNLAKLMLAPILLDTVNLNKAFNRVTQQDVEAFNFLMRVIRDEGDAGFEPTAFFNFLQNAKADVSGLSMVDLLMRDYKQSGSVGSKTGRKVELGISSVGTHVLDLIRKQPSISDAGGPWDAALETLKSFALKKELDILMVMTAYEDSAERVFKRELLLYSESKDLSDFLCAQMEQSTDMGLSRMEFNANNQVTDKMKWFAVRNTKMSRKLVQPILAGILESL
ncbi:hypothetical protein HDU81_008642 [Chytriomyces hyalinus]|nr:hypothetical protein HDU81_008642 [Chytriomyces hyalinus]